MTEEFKLQTFVDHWATAWGVNSEQLTDVMMEKD